VAWFDLQLIRGGVRFLISVPVCGFFFLSPRAEAQFGGEAFGNPGVGGLANQLGAGYGQNTAGGTSGIIGGNRGSLAGWQSYHNYRMGADGQNTGGWGGSEFARLGQARVSMTAALGFGVNNNINSSPTNPLSDGIVQASYVLGFSWQATRRNQLNLNLGFSLQHYLKYSQYNNNTLLIDPQTGLDYRIYFNDFVLTLYDYPSISNSGGSNDPAITNSVNFSQMNNSIGLSLIWNPNQLVIMGGLQRQDTLSLTSNAFDSQNSTGYSAFGTVSYNITPTTSTGLRLQTSTTTYSQQILNDSVTSQAGLFLQTRPTNYTSVYFEGGLQSGTYSQTGRQTSTIVYQQTNGVNTNVAGTLGGGNYAQPYFNLQISNRFNRYLTQSIRFGRTASGSSVANYQEMYNVSYQLQYRLNRVTTLSMNANYQLGKISSGTSSTSSLSSSATPAAITPASATIAGGSPAIGTPAGNLTSSSPAPGSPSSSGTSSLPYSNFQAGIALSIEAVKNTSFGISYNYFYNKMPSTSATYSQQILAFTISHRF